MKPRVQSLRRVILPMGCLLVAGCSAHPDQPSGDGGPYGDAAPPVDAGADHAPVADAGGDADAATTADAGTDSGPDATAAAWLGTRQLGVAGKVTHGSSVAVDGAGNVVIVGNTNGGLDGGSATGDPDLFVAKFTNGGAKLFVQQLGVPGYTDGLAVAADGNGDSFVVGYTSGSLPGATVTGIEDAYLAKYDPNGVRQYTRQLGATNAYTSGNAVAMDPSGNVYMSGSTTGTLDGSTILMRTGTYLAKYDGSGGKQFVRQLGGVTDRLDTYGMTADSLGNVYLAGQAYDGIDGNPAIGWPDCFLAKYDSSGTKVYTRLVGAPGAGTDCISVAVDSGDNVWVTGSTDGGLDGNANIGTHDVFVAKYDNQGVKQPTWQLGTAGQGTFANGIVVDATGVYVVGYTNGGLSGNALNGLQDYFFLKYDTAGTLQYTKQYGVSGQYSLASFLALGPSSRVYVVGGTGGGLDGNTQTGLEDAFLARFTSSGVKE